MDTIIRQVSQEYAVRPDALTNVRRGMENEPRNVAIYLARSIRSEPLMSIGAGFGLNRYSAVTRVRSRLKKDKRFRDRLQQIERSILKGQTQT